jgi:predicted metal-dependent phosphoesterase TrpH
MNEPRADLHLHTSYSDGVLSPRELVRRARQAGLQTISITDHDNVAAIPEALEAAEEEGIEVIPGVELNAHVDGREVHLLGYFVDINSPSLKEFLSLLRQERLVRAERIVEKLSSLNIPIPMEKVLEQAGKGSVGRPHIASVIIDEGYAGSHQEVFAKYLGYKGPAYIEKFPCSPEEVISIVTQAGGITFLAHPGNSVSDQMLFTLIKAGLDGIETIHPSHSPEMTAHYRGIVNEYFLMESGGSDFHGGRRNDDLFLGQYTIPADYLVVMRRRLVRHKTGSPQRV